MGRSIKNGVGMIGVLCSLVGVLGDVLEACCSLVETLAESLEVVVGVLTAVKLEFGTIPGCGEVGDITMGLSVGARLGDSLFEPSSAAFPLPILALLRFGSFKKHLHIVLQREIILPLPYLLFYSRVVQVQFPFLFPYLLAITVYKYLR